MPTIDNGVWLTYYPDWSAFRVFRSELTALRYAVDHNMDCKLLAWGADPKESP